MLYLKIRFAAFYTSLTFSSSTTFTNIYPRVTTLTPITPIAVLDIDFNHGEHTSIGFLLTFKEVWEDKHS